MVFWQLTVDANDPGCAGAVLGASAGRRASRSPPRLRDGGGAAFGDRLFDPAGLRPRLVRGAGGEAGNRLPRPLRNARIEIVEAKVAELIRLGASVERRTRHDDPEDPIYAVVMHDPEGNEFCVS